MTANNWPHDSSGARSTAQETDLRPASTFPPAPNGSTDRPSTNGAATDGAATSGAAAKTDAAKEEAGEVTRRAADSAQNVAETAKAEAANVAAEVKTNAKDLLHQAKSDLTAQAGTQQQKVAEGLRSISTELGTMASASDQPGVASDLVRQAAERSSAVASWLDGRDPGSLLSEVKSFARQRPGSFLMLAAGAGILAGRLSRSLSAGAPEPAGNPAERGPAAQVTRVPDTGMAVPPPPVQMPAPEATTAGFADVYPPNPLDAGAAARAGQQDRWASEPVVDGPLQPVDPLREDPFDGGRR